MFSKIIRKATPVLLVAALAGSVALAVSANAGPAHAAGHGAVAASVRDYDDGFTVAKQDDCDQGFAPACAWLHHRAIVTASATSVVHCTIKVAVTFTAGRADDPGVASSCTNGRPATVRQIRRAFYALFGLPGNLHLTPGSYQGHPSVDACIADCGSSALLVDVGGHGKAYGS